MINIIKNKCTIKNELLLNSEKDMAQGFSFR